MDWRRSVEAAFAAVAADFRAASLAEAVVVVANSLQIRNRRMSNAVAVATVREVAAVMPVASQACLASSAAVVA